jgi:hypothetical protein
MLLWVSAAFPWNMQCVSANSDWRRVLQNEKSSVVHITGQDSAIKKTIFTWKFCCPYLVFRAHPKSITIAGKGFSLLTVLTLFMA